MRAHKREEQPWLRYLVLPLVLILFGLVVSYALLAQQQTTPQAKPDLAPLGTPTPTPPKFVCPTTAWVNCMPGPNAPDRPQCTSEFYTWAKANCPDFQGVAY